jgi:hypothetical protein
MLLKDADSGRFVNECGNFGTMIWEDLNSHRKPCHSDTLPTMNPTRTDLELNPSLGS